MELLYLSSCIESHEIEYLRPFHNSHKNNVNGQNFPSFTVFIITVRNWPVDWPVSPSSNTLFKDLPKSSSSIRSIIQYYFSILMLFIVVTYRSQFDSYRFSFSSTVPTFNYTKIYSVILWSKRVYKAVFLKKFISIDVNLFYHFL
jgi:hypothetical protein